MDRRAIKRNNVTVLQLLMKWTNLSDDDVSWEDYDVLAKNYPDFILEDKNSFEAGLLSDEELKRRSNAKRSVTSKVRANRQEHDNKTT
jgi:hypothetical protein